MPCGCRSRYSRPATRVPGTRSPRAWLFFTAFFGPFAFASPLGVPALPQSVYASRETSTWNASVGARRLARLARTGGVSRTGEMRLFEACAHYGVAGEFGAAEGAHDVSAHYEVARLVRERGHSHVFQLGL